jgi:hypothetical protein
VDPLPAETKVLSVSPCTLKQQQQQQEHRLEELKSIKRQKEMKLAAYQAVEKKLASITKRVDAVNKLISESTKAIDEAVASNCPVKLLEAQAMVNSARAAHLATATAMEELKRHMERLKNTKISDQEAPLDGVEGLLEASASSELPSPAAPPLPFAALESAGAEDAACQKASAAARVSSPPSPPAAEHASSSETSSCEAAGADGTGKTPEPEKTPTTTSAATTSATSQTSSSSFSLDGAALSPASELPLLLLMRKRIDAVNELINECTNAVETARESKCPVKLREAQAMMSFTRAKLDELKREMERLKTKKTSSGEVVRSVEPLCDIYVSRLPRRTPRLVTGRPVLPSAAENAWALATDAVNIFKPSFGTLCYVVVGADSPVNRELHASPPANAQSEKIKKKEKENFDKKKEDEEGERSTAAAKNNSDVFLGGDPAALLGSVFTGVSSRSGMRRGLPAKSHRRRAAGLVAEPPGPGEVHVFIVDEDMR